MEISVRQIIKSFMWIAILYMLLPQHSMAKLREFKGYQTKFDYKHHQKEREIAYQFYLDERSQYMPGITKEELGIDLFGIDNDGVAEIFVFVNGDDRCPRTGCPFAILKHIQTNDGMSYTKIPWFIKGGSGFFIYEGDDPKILDSVTLGWHDILIGEKIE